MKYALIGCGRVAPFHITAAEKNSLELVALCDTIPEHTQKLCVDHNIGDNVRRYTDYREMLKENDIELAAIATESGSHAEIALYCIEHGVNVIIEKPISLCMADARKIVETSEKLGVTVCACHQNRFNIAVQQTRRALEEGRFGTLSHGSVSVRWSRDISYYSQDDWRGTWAHDGGALMNQCIHGFDLMRWMMGDEIDEVYGHTSRRFHPYIEAEDFGMAVVSFKNGATATFEGSTNIHDYRVESENLCLYGSNGTVEIGGVAANDMKIWKFSSEHPDDDKNRGLSEHALNVYGNGHTSLYTDVIDAIRAGRKPYVDARAGMRALELVLAIYKSSREGRPVKLPLDDFSTLDMQGEFDNK